MSQASIRRAGPDDALIVAGLTLQCALHRGGRRERGFLDRFARAWSGQHQTRPVWIAEANAEHAGYLLAACVRSLPWPGDGGASGARGSGGSLQVEQFFIRPEFRGRQLGEALLRAAVDWARADGLATVQMRPGPHTRSLCERIGLTGAGDLMELRLDDP